MARFFLVTLALRLVHALTSLAFHVDGDVAVPWLMANDWERTSFHRFFWGQDYLGTPEILAVSKLGHALFGDRALPLGLLVSFGQIEAAIGFAFVFAAILRFRPGFGEKPFELALAVGLLGFLPPAIEKYTFGPGMGYSLVPLSTGLALWLWSRECVRPLSARALAISGAVFAALVSASRLNAIPAAALAFCFLVGPAKRRIRALLPLGAGALAGLLPEAWIGFERSHHHGLTLTQLISRWHNLVHALGQTGIALGTMPVSITNPEDSLYARGHEAISYAPFEAISAALFAGLLWLTRKRLVERPGWIFTAAFALNLALITLDHVDVDAGAARRYSEVLAIALSAWLLLNWRLKLTRALASFKLALLAVYLFTSSMYQSAYGEMRAILADSGFDPKLDCLSGSGGDLSTAMALARVLPKTLAWNWRLPEAYSGALPVDDPKRAWNSCRQILHLDSGEVPIERADAYCAQSTILFREAPVAAHRFRRPLTIHRCENKPRPRTS